MRWVRDSGQVQLCTFQCEKYKTCKLGSDFRTIELELYSTGSKDFLNACKNQSNMIKNKLIR